MLKKILFVMLMLSLCLRSVPGYGAATGSDAEREVRERGDGEIAGTRPLPMVLISRNEMPAPIEGGQEQEITLYFKNLGNTTLKSPVVTVTPTEALLLTGRSSSFAMEDIRAGKTGSTTLRIRAAQNAGTGQQSLGVELKFNYDSSSALMQGTVSDKLPIPTAASDTAAPPAILISGTADAPVSAGSTVSTTITFRNAGKVRVVAPYVTVSVSDALSIVSGTSTFLLDDLEPGQVGSISLTLKAANEITSAQGLEANVKYTYNSGTAGTQGETTGKVGFTTSTTGTEPEPAVPQILIRSYDYGGRPVGAGGKFSLTLQLRNMGKSAVENLLGSIDGGENFTVDGSNTFFFEGIGAGEEKTRDIPMQAVFSAKTGAQPLTVSFRYEYADKKKRTAATQDVKISVPVYQEDRLSVGSPSASDKSYIGEETAVVLPFVNKGKGEISNVEALIEGDADAADIAVKTQYLGNFESGRSGNIGFAVTPKTAGEIRLLIRIRYEDAGSQAKTKEFPFTLTAEEKPAENLTEQEEPAQDGSGRGRTMAVAAGLGVLAVLVLLYRRKKKKAAAAAREVLGKWEDEEESIK